MKGCEEVAVGLVVSCCDGAELLEPSEEVFDQMAPFVGLPIEGLRVHTMASGRDHGCDAACGQRVEHPVVGVEGAVGDQRSRGKARQEHIGRDDVGCLAWGECEAGRAAEPVDHGQDFGRQPSERAADGLPVTGFFGAPALC
jgi:hypothetical protein